MNTSPIIFSIISLLSIGCQSGKQEPAKVTKTETAEPKAISDPLVTDLYTADPSAHVFNGVLYIYPSHDIESGIPQDDLGSHFDMKDYHVYSMKTAKSEVIDHGVALDIKDVPWAGRQMWAPDASEKEGQYFLYFPAKDKDDIFRIGVATSNQPEGPFQAQPLPMEGSFSIDPAVFKDDDGSYYMYFGGIWGGQLQRWKTGEYDPEGGQPAPDDNALLPKMAKLNDDMLGFAETLRDIEILDESGDLLLESDNNRRFFEAAWVHKYDGKYYLSYSTGDTHFIAYGIGETPYGPFTYQGVILKPVLGWTNHHSIVQFNGKWYLFYHDSSLSGGQTHLRNIKMTELTHNPDGSIQTIDPYQ